MKKIKIKKSFVYLFAFFIFLFSSCNQLVSSLNNTSQPENSSLVNKSDNCSVTINVLSANSGERSIGTADAATFTVAKYNLVAQAQSQNLIEMDFTENTVTLELAYGYEWTITVKAYSDSAKSQLILAGEETFTPSDGNPSLDLEITPVIDSTLGNGYYSYNFIFPSSSFVDFYKVCYKMDTSQTFSEETSVENGGTFTMTNVGGAGISAGKHSFSLKVESYSGTTKIAYVLKSYDLMICANQTANKWCVSSGTTSTFSDCDITFSESDLKISSSDSYSKLSNVTYSFSSDSNLQVSPVFNQTDTAYSFVYASTTTSATLNLTTQYAGQEIISSLTPTISSTDSSGQQTLVYIVGSGTYTFTVLSPDKLSQTVYTFTGVSS